MIHVGIVEDTNDPLKLSRCRVRVFGIHDERLSKIPIGDLPWASVMMPSTGASISGIGHSPSGLLEGSMVIVMFVDGESKQQPIILGSIHGIPYDKGLYSKERIDDLVDVGLAKISPDNSVPVKDIETSQDPVQSEEKELVNKSKEQLEVDLEDFTQIPKDPPAGSGGSKEGIEAIINTCVEMGVTNRRVICAILGICGGESRWKPQQESFAYSKDRLIQVFPSIFGNDEEKANAAVKNPELLPEILYGFDTAKGKALGNDRQGDGKKFIGRGLIQLTGRANYQKYGALANVDLINNPELLNSDIKVSAKVAIAYVLDRTKSSLVNKKPINPDSYFEIAKKAVGYNTPDIAAKKKSYYDYFMGGAQPVGEDAAMAAEEAAISQQSPKEFNFVSSNKKIISNNPSTSGLGFKDPNGKYPLYIREQDTSRLSRNAKIAETIVQKKIDRRTVSIPKIYGQWEEQRPPYSAQYPHNKVYETHSGHVIEIDDSPGSERIHVYHRSGSYIEIDNTGSMTTRIVGSNYEIVDFNNHLYVKGALNITTGGSANILVGGTLTANVQGSALVSVTEDIKVKGSNIFVEAKDSLNLKSGSELNIESNSININSFDAKITGNESVHIRGVTSLNLDGGVINQNAGASAFASSAKGSGLASPGESLGVVLDNPQPNSSDRQTEISFESEDDGDYTEHQRRLIQSGLATPEELAMNPNPGESVEQQNKTNESLVAADCAAIASLSEFPDSLRLSPNFTLGMVSSNAAVSKNKVISQNGLQKEEIICNLQTVCLNVLEHVKKKYPNMIVTSAFRQGAGKSQHSRGQAVDIQFTGVGKNDYYNIAKDLSESLPVFDQFLLEYKNYGSKNPWIHISCTNGQNRRQVLTFWNDRTYAQGLTNLGSMG